ncbi:MAG: hypothetical protein QXW80_03090 [Candidatus Micrarchaeia archaeon]|uniref:hypothetical protein n=1 Tax=Saccharolobus sp. TaxID=2100761 RepID=UPI003178EFEF
MKEKTYKIIIAILLVSTVVASVLAYNFWLQRQYTFMAKISTNIDFKIYWDLDCTQEFTGYDFGTFGAGSKSITLYLKNLSNDKARFCWNITTEGWTINYFPNSNQYYTNGVFNFTIYRYHKVPDDPTAWVWNPNYLGYLEEPNTIVAITLRCWTNAYQASSASWTVTWYAYDNLS